jgi:hypothetical protein
LDFLLVSFLRSKRQVKDEGFLESRQFGLDERFLYSFYVFLVKDPQRVARARSSCSPEAQS